MLKVDFSYRMFTKNVVDGSRDRIRKRLDYSGGIVRRIARRSLKFKANPSKSSRKGTPPHTHGQRKLKNSIFFARDNRGAEQKVYIGPVFSRVRDVGKAHEFGGPYKSNGIRGSRYSKSQKKVLTNRPRIYPKRPFMNPALREALPKLPQQFANIL